MEKVYITFRSVTGAQRGERVLAAGGIRSRMQRTPRYMEEQGCGYCLEIRGEDRQEALLRLQQHSLPYRKCYIKTASGRMEALP